MEEPLTPETLQQKLNEYHAAYRQEFELAEEAKNAGEKEGDAEEVTREFFKKHVPIAAANIVHLAQFSTSDATRLSASKFIIDQGLKSDKESGDPIQALIDSLQGQGKKDLTPKAKTV